MPDGNYPMATYMYFLKIDMLTFLLRKLGRLFPVVGPTYAIDFLELSFLGKRINRLLLYANLFPFLIFSPYIISLGSVSLKKLT